MLAVQAFEKHWDRLDLTTSQFQSLGEEEDDVEEGAGVEKEDDLVFVALAGRTPEDSTIRRATSGPEESKNKVWRKNTNNYKLIQENSMCRNIP